jgi:MFS family permease
LVLAAAAFVVSLGYGALMPVIPGWLASLDPSLPSSTVARYVGELSGIYMLGVFAGALICGYLADALGRRAVLLTGLLLFLLAQLATVHASSVAALYVLRLLAGLAGSAVVPVSNALIAEGSEREDAPRRLAFVGAASLLGFLVGPGLVSLPKLLQIDALLQLSGSLFAFAMHATLVPGTLALVAAWQSLGRLPVPMERAQVTERASSSRSALFALLGINFSTLLALGGFEVAVTLYANQQLQLDAFRVSLMFAECSVVMLLINGFLFLTPLSSRFPVRMLLAASLGAMSAGFVLLYWGTGYGQLLAAVALIAAGSGVAMPLITWSATTAKAPHLGARMGKLAAAGSLGQAVGSIAGGWLFALLSAQTFLMGALLVVLSLATTWIGIRDLPEVPVSARHVGRQRAQPGR